MTVFVFTGPTLTPADAQAELDAVYLPPVSQGDVYRVALTQPQGIAIIDGYFELQPAVWHKEILWAMERGIHVFGGASMGALRAAELASFGMEGVGKVFESYRDGVLEDDDEVALVHGSADAGYRPASEAMVNIRATLARGEAANVLSPSTRTTLERIAKELFYPERSYPRILALGRELDLPGAELDAFTRWLPEGRVDQKREDALTMLRIMRGRLPGAKPKRVGYALEHTCFWEELVETAEPLGPDAGDGVDMTPQAALLEELRLRGPKPYNRACREALLRQLVLSPSRRRCPVPSDQAVTETTVALCHERALESDRDFERWLDENDLSAGEFGSLMQQETSVNLAAVRSEREILPHLLSYLRTTGEYAGLQARARDKLATLQAGGVEMPGPAELGETRESLTDWYFDHISRPVPADLSRYAVSVGFADKRAFERAILRELCYLRLKPAGASDRMPARRRAAARPPR